MMIHILGRMAHPADSALDVWVLDTYAAGAAPRDATSWHLRRCSRCRRRAAMSWALMADPPPVSGQRMPAPDLSFLAPVRSQP